MDLVQRNGKNRLTFTDSEMKRFPFEGKPVLGIKDTIYISGTAYCKTEDAFQAAQEKALSNNYDDSITKPEDRDKGVYFSLNDKYAAECGSCDEVISAKGVKAHGHECECCGDPTYLKYTRDGAITFQFIRDQEYVGREALSFRIFGYREHEDKPNELLIFPKPLTEDYTPPRHEKRGWNGLRLGLFAVRDPDEAQIILKEAEGLYDRETIHDPITNNDIEVLVLKDPEPGMITEESVFNTHDTVGQIHNHKMIKIYDGKKYGEWDNLPIPDSFDLTKRYIGRDRHSLTEPNIHELIMSAAGQVSRADYYYQDGSAAFSDVVYKRMTDFVENFVDADPEEWAVFLFNAPKDGPGFIHGLASWCAAMSDGQKRHIRNEPNIGNALVGASKLLSGQQLTYAESVAMTEGAETPEADKLAKNLMDSFEAQQKGENAASKSRIGRWLSNNIPGFGPNKG